MARLKRRRMNARSAGSSTWSSTAQSASALTISISQSGTATGEVIDGVLPRPTIASAERK